MFFLELGNILKTRKNTVTWEPQNSQNKKPHEGKKPLEERTKRQATRDSIGVGYAYNAKSFYS